MLRVRPALPGGAYWPGGIAAHANGDLHMVFGRWAHRLSPELDVLASHRLPVPRPHNSFVVLDGGELVTKDCDAPAGLEPSTVSVLDPETLLPVAAAAAPPRAVDRPALERRRERDRGRDHGRLPAPPRPRRRPDRDRRELAPALRPGPGPRLRLGPGDHRRARLLDGQRAQPHRPHDARQRRAAEPGAALVGAPRRRRPSRSTEISGLPYGTESNPPGWDPRAGPSSPTTPATRCVRAWRIDGDELVAAVAPRRPRPRRPPDRLPGHARARRRATGTDAG